MLIWAGLIEAFFSQWHEPVMPYALKIAFGLVELTLLILFLSKRPPAKTAAGARFFSEPILPRPCRRAIAMHYSA